jgi:hypothetical protein
MFRGVLKHRPECKDVLATTFVGPTWCRVSEPRTTPGTTEHISSPRHQTCTEPLAARNQPSRPPQTQTRPSLPHGAFSRAGPRHHPFFLPPPLLPAWHPLLSRPSPSLSPPHLPPASNHRASPAFLSTVHRAPAPPPANE